METIPVRDPTDVAEARRRVGVVASRLGYDTTSFGQVAIVVTEAATNILKYAERGEILISGGPVASQSSTLLEVLAIDHGRDGAVIDSRRHRLDA